ALVYTAFILVFYREGMNQILLFVVFLAVALFLLSLIFPVAWILVGIAAIAIVVFWGTNVDKGKEIIRSSGLNVIAADDLKDGAQKIVKAVKG
ncbi:MAG: hypothetical protein R6U99_07460, partial [Nioella sp.]